MQIPFTDKEALLIRPAINKICNVGSRVIKSLMEYVPGEKHKNIFLCPLIYYPKCKKYISQFHIRYTKEILCTHSFVMPEIQYISRKMYIIHSY